MATMSEDERRAVEDAVQDALRARYEEDERSDRVDDSPEPGDNLEGIMRGTPDGLSEGEALTMLFTGGGDPAPWRKLGKARYGEYGGGYSLTANPLSAREVYNETYASERRSGQPHDVADGRAASAANRWARDDRAWRKQIASLDERELRVGVERLLGCKVAEFRCVFKPGRPTADQRAAKDQILSRIREIDGPERKLDLASIARVLDVDESWLRKVIRTKQKQTRRNA